MRTIWLTCILSSIFAQGAVGDVVIISETGEPFRLYLNGEWLSEAPVTRVEAHDVPEGAQRATIYIYPSEGRVVQFRTTLHVEQGMIEYYAIRKRRNQYRVALYNRVPKENVIPPTLPPSTPSTPTPPPPSAQTPPTGGQTQSQNTTIIFNPTIQVQTGGGTQVNAPAGSSLPPSPAPTPHSGGSAYTGPCNCTVPMSRESFLQALRTLRQEPFDQTRLELAKSIARQNCLLSQDIREMVQTLDFEDNRLELAKYAYDFTHDLSNYFMVNEAFQFSSSREALSRYIQSRPARQHCQPGAFPVSPIGTPGAPPIHRPCTPCMSATDFSQAVTTLNRAGGDLNRLSIAKQIAATNCLTSAQVRDICQLFGSEITRLDFAKHAYLRTCDPQNYFVVNQAFSSGTSQQELSQYIQSLSGR